MQLETNIKTQYLKWILISCLDFNCSFNRFEIDLNNVIHHIIAVVLISLVRVAIA